MARDEYQVVNEYLGDGTDTQFEFDFKIGQLADLQLVMIDDDGVEIHRVRGDDTTIVDSVDFDAVAGGGEVTLLDELPTGYRFLLILAPDTPTQPFEFKDKGDFTLAQLEAALDWLGGIAQRAIYLGLRSIRLNDADDLEDFDPTLPKDITDEESGTFIGVNASRNGIALYNADDIASDVVVGGPQNITNGMVATAIEDMVVNGAQFSSAEFMCEVLRGTTIGCHVRVSVFRINGIWELSEGGTSGIGAHGLDFTIEDDTAETCQIEMADLDASGAGTIKFKRVAFNVAS